MVNIKKSNGLAIRKFMQDPEIIQGIKLHALYRLIQAKGEKIQSDDKRFNGVKCIEFIKGEYVAIIHHPVKKGSFFPCMLKTIHLQNI